MHEPAARSDTAGMQLDTWNGPTCTTRAQAGGPQPKIGSAPVATEDTKYEPIARSDTI
eukprot:SAG11_NODE_4271_length_1975_cov_2.452026_1_plen_58_part_00